MKASTLLAAVLSLTAVVHPACRPALERHRTPARHVLGDGRYVVEIENPVGGSAQKFSSHSEGTNVTDEHYDLTWGEAKSLKIDNGRLTISGKPHGELKPGDVIVVRADNTVLVNGAERKPE